MTDCCGSSGMNMRFRCNTSFGFRKVKTFLVLLPFVFHYHNGLSVPTKLSKISVAVKFDVFTCQLEKFVMEKR